jgi:hypothetical protein
MEFPSLLDNTGTKAAGNGNIACIVKEPSLELATPYVATV